MREDADARAGREGARDRASCAATGRCGTTQVIAAGGLHIVGTERHESRRIDNQLRGRSGRQGDPGSSRFYLSLEDPLLRIFGGERLSGDHAAAEDARRRADRASDRQPLDRQGAEPRRVAQLRHPQAAARVRRRRQRPAPRHLPAAQRAARDRRHLGDDPQHDRRPGRGHGRTLRSARVGRGAVGHPGARSGAGRRVPDAGAGRRVAQGRAGADRRERCASASREVAIKQYEAQGRRRSGPSCSTSSSAT